MKEKLLAWAARFDALARRERALLAGAAVVGILLLGFSVLVEPGLKSANAERLRGEQAQADLEKLNGQIALLKQAPDLNAGNRRALEEVRARVAENDARLNSLETTMVPPDKMRAFIESLLAQHRQVELVGLRTLAPAPLAGSADGDSSNASVRTIYKHGVELRIAGRYNDLLAYLTALEKMPQRILWSKIVLTVDQYPRSVLTVTVYTLSLDKQWLIV